MGYEVISFAYDDVAHRPDLCKTLLQMVISRYHSVPAPDKLTHVAEKETVRLAFTVARSLRPIDVEKHLGITHRNAVQLLKTLSAKGYFVPVTGPTGRHIVGYEIQRIAAKRL